MPELFQFAVRRRGAISLDQQQSDLNYYFPVSSLLQRSLHLYQFTFVLIFLGLAPITRFISYLLKLDHFALFNFEIDQSTLIRWFIRPYYPTSESQTLVIGY